MKTRSYGTVDRGSLIPPVSHVASLSDRKDNHTSVSI